MGGSLDRAVLSHQSLWGGSPTAFSVSGFRFRLWLGSQFASIERFAFNHSLTNSLFTCLTFRSHLFFIGLLVAKLFERQLRLANIVFNSLRFNFQLLSSLFITFLLGGLDFIADLLVGLSQFLHLPFKSFCRLSFRSGFVCRCLFLHSLLLSEFLEGGLGIADIILYPLCFSLELNYPLIISIFLSSLDLLSNFFISPIEVLERPLESNRRTVLGAFFLSASRVCYEHTDCDQSKAEINS